MKIGFAFTGLASLLFLCSAAGSAQTAAPISAGAVATQAAAAATVRQSAPSGNTGQPASGLQMAPQEKSPAQPAPSVREPTQEPVKATGRRRIGLALGGGGALALSEIGVLRWFEDNHIPVDAIAGTSMGSLVGALYASGRTPDQIAELTSDRVFSQVFRLDQDFRQLNFRRREDARFLPGGFGMGLKHGVALRNGVLLDYGLNQFLNAQFLPYGANFNFDRMPIPFRCVATDILVGSEAVFNRGPLAEAVRASISIPGVFPPLEDGGHIYVDGALTENLPTDLVKRDLHADVVLAVSLPLTPPDKGDTGSLLGILQRSFSVASWSNEVRSRALADVLIEPVAPAGVGAADYAKADALAKAGYEAAARVGGKLLQYRLDDAAWAAYLGSRKASINGPQIRTASVIILAPNGSTANGVRNTVADLAGKPLRPATVDARQNEIRSDGRFDADYFLTKPGEVIDSRVTGPANEGRNVPGRELLHPVEKRGAGTGLIAEDADADAETGNSPAGRAISNVPVNNTIPVGTRDTPSDTKKDGKSAFETVAPLSQSRVEVTKIEPPSGFQPQAGDADLNIFIRDKAAGPPFLLLGGNILAQTGGTARATVDAVLTQQDFGGYRSEFRTTMRFGFLTQIEPEYYRRLTRDGLFLAPRLNFYRAPVYIWQNQKRVAERQTLQAGGGIDLGYTFSHYMEVRAGWQEFEQHWRTETGTDGLPDLNGHSQLARVQFRFNGQDRALIPLHGLRIDSSLGYQYDTLQSANTPRFQTVAAYFRDIGHGNTLSLSGEGGSYFNRRVADPFRFTLGGPLRLAASSFDEYRGTDYFLLRPAYFRRIAQLPSPLGQSIYVVGSYELGQMRSPDAASALRQDVFFGLAAETPLGAFTLGPAIGDHDRRKLVFTLGRFF